MKNKTISKHTIITGTLIATAAAAAGYIAGVLTAPKAGRETRADIKQKATDIEQTVEKRTKAAQKTARTTLHKAEKIVAAKTTEARNAAARTLATKKVATRKS